jgi:hypothetical protein
MDGEFRTDHGAHLTTGTLGAVVCGDKIVPFAVSLGGLVENMVLAELDTKVAPLTPLRHHNNLILF